MSMFIIPVELKYFVLCCQMATTSECLKIQSKTVKQLCRLFPMRRVSFYLYICFWDHWLAISPGKIRIWSHLEHIIFCSLCYYAVSFSFSRGRSIFHYLKWGVSYEYFVIFYNMIWIVQLFINAYIRIYIIHFLICRLLKREKKKKTTVVHMIQYAGSVFLVVSIHILFQQKSYQLPWGNTLLWTPTKYCPNDYILSFSYIIGLLCS